MQGTKHEKYISVCNIVLWVQGFTLPRNKLFFRLHGDYALKMLKYAFLRKLDIYLALVGLAKIVKIFIRKKLIKIMADLEKKHIE